MEKDLENVTTGDISDLLVTSTKWFDVLVKLKQFRLAKEKSEGDKKNDKHRLEIVDWSVTQMLWERYHTAFGHVAIFFANETDGKEIGVKFKPAKDLKGLQAECFGAMGKDAGNEYFLNKVGIVNDLKIVGDGIVESITVQKDF